MATQNKPEKKGRADDLVLCSIGACAVEPEKGKPYIFIAYTSQETGMNVSFCAIPFQSGKKIGYADFLAAIRRAENVAQITYIGNTGAAREIFLCRDGEGRISDPVERDPSQNLFVEGFSEVLSSKPKFVLTEPIPQKLKPFEGFTISVQPGTSDAQKDTYDYAILNAFNACLLGRVFTKPEFDIETRANHRVRFEIRKSGSSVGVNEKVMFIKPSFSLSGDTVDYYETERFTFIDGVNASNCAYRISFSYFLKDYEIIRI